MKSPEHIFGIMAEFDDETALVAAAHAARRKGYRNVDAYSSYPIEGLAEALGRGRTPIPLIMLVGGLCSGAAGYALQYYAMAVDYPLNIGGRPLHSWVSFIPITFELSVLGAALFGVAGMLILNRLPQPYHPVFNVPAFARASQDRFFLCIESVDEHFDSVAIRTLFEDENARAITEVAR